MVTMIWSKSLQYRLLENISYYKFQYSLDFPLFEVVSKQTDKKEMHLTEIYILILRIFPGLIMFVTLDNRYISCTQIWSDFIL